MMAKYEYELMKLGSGGPLSNLNSRLEKRINEGWHPVLMSGDENVNILLRRQRPAAEDDNTQDQQQQT